MRTVSEQQLIFLLSAPFVKRVHAHIFWAISAVACRYEKGYRVITLNPGTAALSDEEQRLATEKNYPMFSRPMNRHEEFIQELAGQKSAAATVGREGSRRTQYEDVCLWPPRAFARGARSFRRDRCAW